MWLWMEYKQLNYAQSGILSRSACVSKQKLHLFVLTWNEETKETKDFVFKLYLLLLCPHRQSKPKDLVSPAES